LLWAGAAHAEPAASAGDLSTTLSVRVPPSYASPATFGYWIRLDTNLDVSSATLEEPWSGTTRALERTPDYSLAGSASENLWGHPVRVPGVVEFDPTRLLASDPQREYRPQFSLGSSSDSLRSWLRFAGIEALGCVAPLMRMHSTVAGSGPHTNVSVSARCSFH
jgi:hypothetical protein